MLISETYRQINRRLHADRPDYGTHGHLWAESIKDLALSMKTTDVLDYGCGKQSLKKVMPFVIGYDPCITGLDDRPAPAELVVCTDVLEHIEPECIDDVMDDLVRVTGSALFALISFGSAKKKLSDGRNAHLIQQGLDWWLPKFWTRFDIQMVHNLGGSILVVSNACRTS